MLISWRRQSGAFSYYPQQGVRGPRRTIYVKTEVTDGLLSAAL